MEAFCGVCEVISVVIPMYNESRRIEKTLESIYNYVQKHPGEIGQVVVVDDGSKDNSVERVIQYVGKLPLWIESLPLNIGKWAAVQKGIDVAKYDVVLLLDADGSASIFELEKVLLREKEGVLEGTLAVFGSRFMPGADVTGKSLKRTIVSHAYRWYVRFWYWFAGDGGFVDDMQAPWKFFNKRAMVGRVQVERWCGDVELALRLKCDKISVPISFHHVRGGAIRISSVFEMLFSTIEVAIRMRQKRE